MSSTKSILENLPLKKREALGRLYESPEYDVLKEVLNMLRDEAGRWALTSTSWEDVKHLQGQAHGLKMLHQNLKNLNKVTNKEIDKGQKKKANTDSEA